MFEFERVFLAVYDHSDTKSFVGELTKLKQDGSTYEEYVMEFMRLSHYVHGLSEEFLIECFISGLKDSIKYELMAKQPKDIIEAMRLAQLEEDRIMSTKKSGRSFYNKNQGIDNSVPYSKSGSAPSSAATTSQNTIKKLTN